MQNNHSVFTGDLAGAQQLLSELEMEEHTKAQTVELLYNWLVLVVGNPRDYEMNAEAVIRRRNDPFIYAQISALGNLAVTLAESEQVTETAIACSLPLLE